MPGPLRDSLEEFARAFVAGARLDFDGTRVALRSDGAGDPPSRSPFTLRFAGRVPAGAATVRFRDDAEIGWFLVEVRNEGVDAPTRQWIDVRTDSKPFSIANPPPAPSIGDIAVQYLTLGFRHIVPEGADHILFVLGLFLLSTRWKPLLAQVTAFTLAHSITLGLAMFGVVSLPSSVVEPAIAASIVYVAVENVLSRDLHRGRIAIVFLFGLLHGLGFASVLRDLGLPRGSFLPALVSFNLGVELGQLTVLAGALLAVGAWFGKRSWYRARVVVPASLAIAAVALYWTVERVMG
jgi:hydrogenase/urease accessory protein HupE